MVKKWIYRLKKEDFAHAALRLNITVDDRLVDMRNALSECYSETENDPQVVDIWAEVETAYYDKVCPSIALTDAEGYNLQKEAHRREITQDRITTAVTSRPSQTD